MLGFREMGNGLSGWVTVVADSDRLLFYTVTIPHAFRAEPIALPLSAACIE